MLDASKTIPTTSTQTRKNKLSPIGASQMELEELFSKHQLKPALHAHFDEAFGDAIEELQIDRNFGVSLMSEIALHRRANAQTMIGALWRCFENVMVPAQDDQDDEAALIEAEESDDEAPKVVPIEDPIAHCAEELWFAAECDLLDWDPDLRMFIVIHEIPTDLQNRLDMFQYPLPMIERPRQVRHNRQTGYLTVPGSIILKKNHHNEDVCLDHINRLNGQALAVNPNVVSFLQNQWKGLDKKRDDEDRDEFMARRRAFQKFDNASRDVLQALMAQPDGFYLTHKYDKRGRTYCQGYHVNPQGNDWSKASVEFAQAETLNEE